LLDHPFIKYSDSNYNNATVNNIIIANSNSNTNSKHTTRKINIKANNVAKPEHYKSNLNLKNHIILMNDQKQQQSTGKKVFVVENNYQDTTINQSKPDDKEKSIRNEDKIETVDDEDVINLLNESNNGFFSISMSIQGGDNIGPLQLNNFDKNPKAFANDIEEIIEDPEKENLVDTVKRSQGISSPKKNTLMNSQDQLKTANIYPLNHMEQNIKCLEIIKKKLNTFEIRDSTKMNIIDGSEITEDYMLKNHQSEKGIKDFSNLMNVSKSNNNLNNINK